MPVKPNLSLQEAADLVRELYGLETEGDSQRQFVSYDDLNVFFKASKSSTKSISEDGYVLKITNSEDSQQPGVLEAQNNIMKQLTDAGLKVPEPVLNLKGELQSMEDIKTAEEGKKGKCLVRVLKFMPGKILVDAKPWEAKHFFQCGSFIGRMFEELLKFPRDEALAKRNYVWSLSAVPAVLDLLWAVEEEDKKALAKEVVAAFEREVLPVVASGRLEEGVVHGDVNEQNILVDVKSGDVSGVIDFGDVSYGPALYDISINIMYMMLHCRPNVEPVSVGGHVLAGFLHQRALSHQERKLLRTCVAARYVQSLVKGAAAHRACPDNDYLLVVAKAGGWDILREFWGTPKEEVEREWDRVVGTYERKKE